jgi:hypothetical protein
MTRDDIIRMARECGLPDWEPVGEKIERFAALVADNAIKPWAKQLKIERKKFQELNETSVGAMQAVRLDEREACANVCEILAWNQDSTWKAATMDCAAAIRARGQE